ncbi:DNA-processing protein DprA [Patescibacteria group bacterium]
MSPSNIYLHALRSVEGIGARRLLRIIKLFGSAQKAYNASPQSLLDLKLRPAIVSSFEEMKETMNLKQELSQLKKNNIELVSIYDAGYPDLLKKIFDPPPLLYLKGDRELLRTRKLAIVGTRQCSSYALKVTRKIIASLINQDVCTVSGLARGIDYCVHKYSLEFDIPTIAVLGCGLRSFTGNGQMRQKCFDTICEKGLVISEFPPDQGGQPQNFPLRNRVISGLAKSVLVVEAPEKSGALITAANALDQNRDVIAVPGPIDSPNSLGANFLIRDGATILTQAEDLPQLLDCEMGCTKKSSVLISGTDLTGSERAIVKALQKEPTTFDNLITQTNLKSEKLNSALGKLLLRNIISEDSPQLYSIA